MTNGREGGRREGRRGEEKRGIREWKKKKTKNREEVGLLMGDGREGRIREKEGRGGEEKRCVLKRKQK